jgi:hypothetical protein
VQPVEIAKALGSAMDDKRTVGVSKVYAPVHYTVSISADDAEEMGAFADTLSGELATYVTARAQEKQYHLSSRPKVTFVVNEKLKLGRFKVDAEMSAPAPAAAAPSSIREDLAARIPEVRPASEEPVATAPPAATPGAAAASPSPGDSATPPPPASEMAQPEGTVSALSTVTVTGIDHDVALSGDRIVIGRLAECDIHLQDANVSREHAAFMAEGTGWAIEDLGSTNGTVLNGKRVSFQRLADGDVIQVGVSELIYHEPRV